MHVVFTENCMFIPLRKVDDLRIGRYYNKKPKSTDAPFAKIVFYNQNVNLCELMGKTYSKDGRLQ